MAASVIEENEIILNGTYFPLTRPIQSVLASIYPSKVVIGGHVKGFTALLFDCKLVRLERWIR